MRLPAELGYLVPVVIVQLPTVLVLVAGMALVAIRWRVLRRSAWLALGGCGALLVSTAVGMAWQLGLPMLVRDGALTISNLTTISVAVGLLSTLIGATGLASLIAAVLVSTRIPDASPPVPMIPDASPPVPIMD